MRKIILTAVTTCLTAVGLILGLAPAQAANGTENPAALCVKNSPASSTYFMVEFFDQARNPQYYNDPVFPSGVEGECGNANVFSEPTQYYVPTGYKTRHRYWYAPYTTATAFSAWISNCGGGQWWWLPGGQSSTYTKSTMTEIQILPC